MAISYPLNTPTNIGIANIAFSAENAVAISQSPFTYAQQIVSHPGQRWGASISLPPMKRQDAEYWVAFLLSLKGQAGTFLLGDPNCVAPQGTALPRKNLLTYTEQFDNAVWIKNGMETVIPNTELAPNGTLTAEKIVPSTALAAHTVLQNSSVVSGQTYNVSIYLQSGGYEWMRISLGNSFTTNYVFINTSTGAVGLNNNFTNIQVTSAGPGWWRASASAVATATGFGPIVLYPNPTNGFTTFSGDGTSGITVWGAQLEVGSTPTSYQSIIANYGPFINGANQTGDTLAIDGASPNESGYLLPGDYIQLGTGSSATLHKVLTTTDTNSAGEATLDIWPSIRTAFANNSAVVIQNAKGRFRLKENMTQWQINDISSYGITFDCVEAL